MISGAKLRAFREKRRVRPVQVATMLGIGRQRVFQIEKTGEVGNYLATRYIGAVLGAQEPDADGVCRIVPVEAWVGFTVNGTPVEL